MKLTELINNLNYPDIETNIKNPAIFDINFIRYFINNESEPEQNVLYIARSSVLSCEQLKNLPINLLLVSPVCHCSQQPIPDFNQNFIYVYADNLDSVFNHVLDTFLEIQRLAVDTVKLMDALSSTRGLQYLMDVGFRLLENPMFIRDSNFNILSFTQNIHIDDFIWNQLITKGYQTHADFQFLLKNGYMKDINKCGTLMYHRIESDLNRALLEKSLRESDLDFNIKYMPVEHIEEDAKINYSRIWCTISADEKVLGQLVVIEALKPFNKYDIALIQKLSKAISLELQKNRALENLVQIQQDSFFTDLLNGKIMTEANLDEKLGILNLNLKKHFVVISLLNTEKNIRSMPFGYIKNFFLHVFRDAYCIPFKNYIAAIYNMSADSPLTDYHIEKLNSFLQDTGMLCGVSRSFSRLLDAPKYYEQTVEAINSGKRMDSKNFLFFYDDYVLQHIFHICSDYNSLQNFCYPALLKLIDYDKQNNTNYCSTLHTYIMKPKNPSDLAKELNVHRNTLYYRLSKISEIMNVDLNNIDTCFYIYFSFKALEYLKK